MVGFTWVHHAPSGQELFQETLNLVNDLPKYDVLRADRSIAFEGSQTRSREFLYIYMDPLRAQREQDFCFGRIFPAPPPVPKPETEPPARRVISL